MEEKNSYNVLRLVLHGSRCYVSTDLIRGKPLIYWLKYHPVISKEQLYQWMKEMVQSLEAFHKCQGSPNYQYINPYSIIVSEDNQVFLLDLGNKKHEDLLHQMQRRMVREHFLSPENQYYQNNNQKEDLYSLGKTLQYLIATSVIEPKLTRWEEEQLRKTISKCLNKNSKKSYQNIQELSEHFPKRKISNHKQSKNQLLNVILGILCFVLLVGNVVLATKTTDKETGKEEVVQPEPKVETKIEVIEKELAEEEKQVFYDLALCYLLDYNDPKRSMEVFQLLREDMIANDYASLMSQIQLKTWDDSRIYELLQSLEEKSDQIGNAGHYLALIKGYEILDLEYANIEKERLVKKCLYEEQCVSIPYWEEKQYGTSLRIWLMKMKCADPSIPREVCGKYIQELLTEMPNLKETREFKVLQKEYEITFEEDKVCVKK